jgi:RNA-directed DNA polymerase
VKRHAGLFEKVLRFDNLLGAARRAARGKRDRPAVARFEFHLERELLTLQTELAEGTYRPGAFFTFEIRDPKRRSICAAPFCDRVVHHAVCGVLEPLFDRRLIFDTCACRPGKGTHAAIARAQHFARRYRYFLKCDVRRFFASVDHNLLRALLQRMFKDAPLLDLLGRILAHNPPGAEPGRGLPIGNLTSQHFGSLFAHVSHADTLTLRRRMVLDFPIKG